MSPVTFNISESVIVAAWIAQDDVAHWRMGEASCGVSSRGVGALWS